jgi:hypothetical protein
MSELINREKALAEELVKAAGELEVFKDRRRIINNELQNLKGRIRVYVRVKPPAQPAQSIITVPNETTLTVQFIETEGKTQQSRPDQVFSFEQVFSATSTQADVFQELQTLVTSVADGTNVCIIAYGQTGSGKTHTIVGDKTHHSRGLLQRSMELLFHHLDETRQPSVDCSVSVQMIEIYLNKQTNMIADFVKSPEYRRVFEKGRGSGASTSSQKTELQFRGSENNFLDSGSIEETQALRKVAQKQPNAGPILPEKLGNQRGKDYGPESIETRTLREAYAVLNFGSASRTTSQTNLNEQSSRSHLIFKLILTIKDRTAGTTKTSSLAFVDLAGSERMDEAKTEGRAKEEGIEINKSLSALKSVIIALYQDHSTIPFRQSELTFALQEYFSANSKTLMVVNVSSDPPNYTQTLNSLGFGKMVRQTKAQDRKR